MNSRFAFALILCTDISAQVPTGRVAVLYADASNGPTIAQYDGALNRTAKQALGLPYARAIECSSTGDAWLVASAINGTTSLHRVPSANGSLGTPQALHSSLSGDPRDLLFLDNDKLLLLTTTSLYRCSADYSTCVLLASLADEDGRVYSDLSLTATGYAALSVTSGAARIQRFDPDGTSQSDSVYAIPLATSLVARDGGFLVSTAGSNGAFYRTVGATSELAEDPPAGQPVHRARGNLRDLNLVNGAMFGVRRSGPLSAPVSIDVGGQILDLAPTPVAMLAPSGVGCAGTTSAPPAISGRGHADDLAFAVMLRNAPAGSTAVLRVGTEAMVGTLPLSPSNCFTLTDAVTTYQCLVAADGTAMRMLSLPAAASTLHMQWVVLGASAQTYSAASAAGQVAM